MNRFRDYYQNPIALGLLPPGQSMNGRNTMTFGQPSYGTQAMMPGNTGLNSGMMGSAGTTTFSPGGNVSAFSVLPLLATRTAPAPASAAAASSGRLLTDARSVIDRSSAIPSKAGIQVGVEGTTVVLRGTVSDERERRAAENMLRFTPGVSEVRNELVIGNARSGRP
jgi:hypothetical protein